MKRHFKNLIFLVLIVFFFNIQISTYAMTNNLKNYSILGKGSENIMSISDTRIKSNGDYSFKIDNLNLSIYELDKDHTNTINESTLTDSELKNSTYKDMFFTKDKLILIYEILTNDFIPYNINIDSQKRESQIKNKSKTTFVQSSNPGNTLKRLFDSRRNLILFYDISDIENIKLENKIYINGDYETCVQKDDDLYLLTSVIPNKADYYFNDSPSDLNESTEIINIDNAKSKRIHNLNKVDLVEQKFEKISSIKCDSIMEYLSKDSLYFINLDSTKNSTVHRLSLTSDKPDYVNKFTIDGYLTNPEFINEYDIKLTFIYQTAENYKNYNLVQLDQNLNLLNEIKNINSSKEINEVNFIKNSVNILIDSALIKTVDFSTPSEPKICESETLK